MAERLTGFAPLLSMGSSTTESITPPPPMRRPRMSTKRPKRRDLAPDVEGDRLADAQADLGHLVDLDLARRSGARLKRDRVQRPLDPEDPRLGLLGPQLQRDQFARAKRRVVDPEDPGGERPAS
jgi:hypothetical protein